MNIHFLQRGDERMSNTGSAHRIRLGIAWILAGMVLIILSSSPLFAQPNVEERLEALEREMNALREILDAREDEVEKLRGQLSEQQDVQQTAETPSKPEAGFGGQYRINFYNAGNDTNNIVDDDDDQRAARLRIRQNVDLKFSEEFKTHLQLELQHTTDNLMTTDVRMGGEETNVSVRHAVMDYTFGNGTNLQAGLVPLHDYFHDTLFSSDWDYNPLAAAVNVPIGPGKFRAFAANLKEGAENIEADDFVHYQVDYSLPLGEKAQIVFTGTALNLEDFAGQNDSMHYNMGIGGHLEIHEGMAINGFILGSSTNKALLGTTDDADGVGLLLELTAPLGPGNFGIMASYTSGDSDGTGFLAPMAFAQTFGYWGYTGILTIQGATDTGFDFDGVNFSNNGLGMTSVQAKYAFPVTNDLSGYIAAGWFGNTDAAGRDDDVGIDLLGMGTYRFTKELALDFGVAYASLKDSVSGYFQGVQKGGVIFNQDVGIDRDKLVFFGRLQAEF